MILTVLAYGVRRRREVGPLVLGSVGSSVVVLPSKCVLDIAPVACAASGVILVASVCNAWPKAVTHEASPSGASGGTHELSIACSKGGSR